MVAIQKCRGSQEAAGTVACLGPGMHEIHTIARATYGSKTYTGKNALSAVGRLKAR